MLPRALQIPSVIQEALGVVGGTSTIPKELKIPEKGAKLPINAGLQLMLRNSDHIEDLCLRNALNEEKLQNCDLMIAQLYANLEEKTATFARLNVTLAVVGEIQTQLKKSQQLLEKVTEQLNESKLALMIMEDTRDMVDNKRKELEQIRERDRLLKVERQKIFEEQFRNDLELFKKSGEVAASLARPITPCEDLSEINLDQNDDEIEAFNHFLESSGDQSDISQDLSRSHFERDSL